MLAKGYAELELVTSIAISLKSSVVVGITFPFGVVSVKSLHAVKEVASAIVVMI